MSGFSQSKYLHSVSILLPSLEIGGFATIANELTDFFTDNGIKVSVFTLYGNYSIEEPNVNYTSSQASPSSILFVKIGLFMKRIRYSQKFFRLNAPTLVICLDPISFLLAFLSYGFSNKTKLVVACGTPFPLFTKVDRFVSKYLFRFAKVVVVPSDYSKQELSIRCNLENVVVVPNPIPFHSTYCLLNSKDRNQAVVHFMGRLSPEKGLSNFLSIVKSTPSARFQVSGDGPQKELVLDFINKNPDIDLEYNGWARSSFVFPRSRILVVPSLQESFGIVLLEAWIHGLNVIAFGSASGPSELIGKHKHGKVFNSVEEISDWINTSNLYQREDFDVDFLREILETYSSWSVGIYWLKLICSFK